MARAPFQVLVIPYRQVGEGEFEYALLRRADDGSWHAIAGGGEDSETPVEAARREAREETGLPEESLLLALDVVVPVPVTAFRDSHLWGDDLYVIPQYCFGVLARKPLQRGAGYSCSHRVRPAVRSRATTISRPSRRYTV